MTSGPDPNRRPGTFGAGFLVSAPDHPNGWQVYTYEHSIVWDPEPRVVRRRIAHAALHLGLKPCSSYDDLVRDQGLPVPTGPQIAYCFEVDPANVVHPHLSGHPEWRDPEAILAVALLEQLGFTVKLPDAE